MYTIDNLSRVSLESHAARMIVIRYLGSYLVQYPHTQWKDSSVIAERSDQLLCTQLITQKHAYVCNRLQAHIVS
jgi:hypothetical protein